MTFDPPDSYPLPTPEQLFATETKINHYLHQIKTHPHRRPDAAPDYQFHKEITTPLTTNRQSIRGTVLIFHDFSAKPTQTQQLADYLYQNHFNIYQASMAGHSFLPPEQFWPQVTLKPPLYQLIRHLVTTDPIFQNYRHNLNPNSELIANISLSERTALMERLLTLEPRLQEIITALERETIASATPYFTSNAITYLEEAQARLGELAELPSPIYAIGIGFGATVALALAADRPYRIKRVVAYGPLLKLRPELYHYWLMAGALEIKEPGWQGEIACPAGTWAAMAEFSQSLSSLALQKALRKVPIFWVSTLNDDLADPRGDADFVQQIGGTWKGHRHYVYPTSALVPRSLLTPRQYHNGMSNYFWSSLYQETFRFLTTGEIDRQHLSQWQEDPKLPRTRGLGV